MGDFFTNIATIGAGLYTAHEDRNQETELARIEESRTTSTNNANILLANTRTQQYVYLAVALGLFILLMGMIKKRRG